MYLKDIWPTSHEIAAVSQYARDPEVYRRLYGNVADANPMWGKIEGVTGQVYDWPTSTYIAKPPFFDGFTMKPGATTDIVGARALGIFGDSVTTDHISPAGAIKENSPAGKWLLEHGVPKVDFNSYGSRRGNHEVMMRGTFANVRIKNLMLPLQADGRREEGGVTLFQPGGDEDVHLRRGDAVHRRKARPLSCSAARNTAPGHRATGRPRAPQLLGVKAVDRARASSASIAATSSAWACCRCQFKGTDSVDIARHQRRRDVRHRRSQGHPPAAGPHAASSVARTAPRRTCAVLCRIDTPIEVDYYNDGGILPFVLRDLMAA